MNKSLFAAASESQENQQGVVLLEVLIAVLIFSVGLLGLIGLQGSMVKGATSTKYRVEASYLAQQTLGALWADPCNLAAYSVDGEDISAYLPNGTRTITNYSSGTAPLDTCGNAQVIDQTVVTIAWQSPGETEVHRVVNSASITGG